MSEKLQMGESYQDPVLSFYTLFEYLFYFCFFLHHWFLGFFFRIFYSKKFCFPRILIFFYVHNYVDRFTSSHLPRFCLLSLLLFISLPFYSPIRNRFHYCCQCPFPDFHSQFLLIFSSSSTWKNLRVRNSIHRVM